MKVKLLLISFIVCCFAYSKESQPSIQQADSSSWKHSMIVSANITQVSFTDWAQGGENALAYALFLDGKSVYKHDSIEWANSYKFGYGQARLGSLGIRKTDDMINFESVLTYKLGVYLNPYTSVSLKTQFTEGVIYDAAGTATPVSDFFDPAYVVEAVGVGYRPVQEVNTRLGLALREIFTSKYFLYSDDPTTTQLEKTRIDGGLESVTEANVILMENIVFNSKLEIFAPLKRFEQTTVRSDNTLSAKVNKYISVNLNALLINDPQVKARTQVKETLALGISFTLI
jgi:hypothetical protein